MYATCQKIRKPNNCLDYIRKVRMLEADCCSMNHVDLDFEGTFAGISRVGEKYELDSYKPCLFTMYSLKMDS